MVADSLKWWRLARTAEADECSYRGRQETPLRFVAVVLGMVVIHLLPGCQGADSSDASTQKVMLDGRAFELELALDNDSRFQGLSDRSEIIPSGGMLFVFPQPSRLQFVMRRCLVPIDLIYLDPGGRIIMTYPMAIEPFDTPDGQLRRYSSQYDAQFAIELKGGMLQQLNLTAGMKIDLPLDRLKHRAH